MIIIALLMQWISLASLLMSPLVYQQEIKKHTEYLNSMLELKLWNTSKTKNLYYIDLYHYS